MTMRDDVRTAFERQQSALGDVGDARHRLMHEAMVNRDVPTSRGLQWAAGLAAVLIAAIVITTFALVRAGSHTPTVPAATPTPRAQASPTPLANQLQVPASTPIILFHDPASFDQLDGVTWDGKTSGKVGSGAASAVFASPDGHMYVTSTDKGQPSPYWADDSIHYCTMVRAGSPDATVPGVLFIGAQGQQHRKVAQLGTFGASNLNAGDPAVVACSPAGDRAVVYQAGGQGIGVAAFWVVQLSTGRILWHGGAGAAVAATHDGMYIALTPATTGPTVIYGPNGAVVGQTNDQVLGFSWDGTLAVVASNPGNRPSVVDWRDGQTIWTCPKSTSQLVEMLAEPGGSHLAIGAADPSYQNTNGFQPVDLYVIGPDGVVVFEKKDVTLA